MSEESKETLPEPDYASMSMDDLAALANAPGVNPLGEEDEAEAVEASDESDDQEEETVEAAEAEDASEEAEQESESTDAPAEDDDLEMLRAELAAARTTMEEERALREHFETVAGRHGGKLGYLEQEIAALKARVAEASATDEYGEPTRHTRDTRLEDGSSGRQMDNKLLFDIAIQQGIAAWQANNPKAVVTDESGKQTLDPEVFAAIERNAKSPIYSEALSSGDPLRTRDALVSLLDVASKHVEAQRAQAKIEEMRKRRADQANTLRDKKRVAASAKSGTARAAPRRKPVDLNSMPLDELRKLADATGI